MPVAHGAVHVAAVSRDVAERVTDVNLATGFTDNNGQLAFIIELAGENRFYHRPRMPGLRIRKTDKQRGGIIGLGKLFSFFSVIHANAENFSGRFYNGQKGHVFRPNIHRAIEILSGDINRIPLKEIFQGCILMANFITQVDKARLSINSVAFTALMNITC